jgi:hypothetical protein
MYHGELPMVDLRRVAQCDWLVADPDASPSVVTLLPPGQWTEVAIVSRPTDRNDRLLVLHRRDDGR